MPASPKVSRIVLFKHGVAYLERSGPADGDFDLSFKQDEMNDVLKSLSVWVAAGSARVDSVAFEAPADPEEALAKRKLVFGKGQALLDLLQSLRGRRVAVGIEDQRLEGEVIGVERINGGDGGERRSLVLRTDTGSLTLRDLAAVSNVELLEEASQRDLAFVVDRTRAATSGENRSVRIKLSGSAEDLRVAYVVPAPIWRVSYRVVREQEDVLLMGWGIVHNPADEDIEDVELTLTTGQPVSFEIDLYHPKLVTRRKVEEKSRAAAGPMEFERPTAPSFAPQPPASMMMPAPALQSAMGDAMLGAMAGSAAETADRGELFEYRVLSKVSLARGGSAMVPLLAARISAKKERLWRPGSGPHPSIAFSFVNTSGAVLEEGPAVFYSEGAYAGEAMVPYTTRGTAVKLAFARDLSVTVRAEEATTMRVSGIRLADALVYEDQVRELTRVVSVESTHDEDVDVIVELPKTYGRELHPDTTQPTEETASFRRFLIAAGSRKTTTLRVVEWWSEGRSLQYEKLTTAALSHWIQNGLLVPERHKKLQEIVNVWASAGDFDRQEKESERRATESYSRQKRIGEQLGVLRADGPEGALRLKHVRELEIEQAEAARHEQEAKRHRGRAEDLRQQGHALLAQVAVP